MREISSVYGTIREVDGILHLKYSGENIKLSDAQKLVQDRLDLTNYSVSFLFFDGTNVKSIDKETRDFFGSSQGTYLVGGIAIYSNSKLATFLANFLVNVNLVRYNFPIKVFSDKEEAIQWIKNIKKHHG